MIEIECYEDLEFKQFLLEALHKSFARSGEERTGIHVSDLVYCLKKAWHRRQEGHEEELTDDSVMYFVRGRSLHDMIERLPVFGKNEYRVLHEDVKGTIDAVGLENSRTEGMIFEIKTTKKLWNDTPTHHNTTQLRYYMAMYNTQIGYLLYYEMFTNRLRPFKFVATQEQLEGTLKEISAKNKLLKLALEKGDVSILPKADESWECNFCEFEQCPHNTKKEYQERRQKRGKRK
ncbi:MAG: CRISPR-associated protein Cas4 [Candidatus Thorarchaeota archaeon]